MDRTMVDKSLTESQKRYCIYNCEYGKRKAKELLQTCDSVFDAVIDMQEVIQECFGSPQCGLKNTREEGC